MNAVTIIFWLILYLSRIDCSDSSSDDGEKVEFEPLYPRSVGIVNSQFTCYMNSLFSCLYNIPLFQTRVFETVRRSSPHEDSKSTLFALGKLFKDMRTHYTSIDLSEKMMPVITENMNWNFGEYECVLEFWDKFVETLPENIKKLFKVEIKTRYLRSSDDSEIKTSSELFNYVLVPIPNYKSEDDLVISLSEIIESKFLDNEMEGLVLTPEDQAEHSDLISPTMADKILVPVKNVSTIENTPDIIIFGLKRSFLKFNEELKEQVMDFNDNDLLLDDINVKGEDYVPMSYVRFSDKSNHYTAVTRDFVSLKYYFHNDEEVGEAVNIVDNSDLSPKDFNNNAVMVFYIKLSAWEHKKEGIIYMVQNALDISEILDDQRNKNKRRAIFDEVKDSKRRPRPMKYIKEQK